MKELKSYIRVFAVAAAWCLCVSAGAVTGPADSLGVDIPALKARTDSLMRQYRFSEAVDVFLRAKDNADSTLRAEIDAMMAPAQNGASMAGFCCSPVVVASQRLSLKDYCL